MDTPILFLQQMPWGVGGGGGGGRHPGFWYPVVWTSELTSFLRMLGELGKFNLEAQMSVVKGKEIVNILTFSYYLQPVLTAFPNHRMVCCC